MRYSSQRGYTMPEMILGFLLLSAFMGVVLLGFIGVQRMMIPRSAMIDGQVVAVAPSYAPFPAAVELHRVLSDRVGEATAVYVFGGLHPGLPTSAVVASQGPLGFSARPDFAISTLPMDARSFYQAYPAALGGVRAGADPEDFSVVVVGPRGGAAQVICAVQVSRIGMTMDVGVCGDAFVRRTVTLYDFDGTTLTYSFLERAGQGVFVGAVHTWYRYRETGSIFEEGPASVAFPDPWVYAGSRGRSDDIPPFSRFTYSFPVSQ